MHALPRHGDVTGFLGNLRTIRSTLQFTSAVLTFVIPTNCTHYNEIHATTTCACMYAVTSLNRSNGGLPGDHPLRATEPLLLADVGICRDGTISVRS